MKKAPARPTSHLISFCLIIAIAMTALMVATRSSWAASAYSTIKSWAVTPQKKEAPLVGEVTLTATAGTAAGSFTTLKGAFDAINAGTHQGVIAISINADTTETATAALNASGSGSASYTSISIQPAGGAARTISGAIAAGSPLINLNGADNVTIDGLNTGGNSLTISNTTIGTTTGTSTIRFIADATNNTVTNCSILGSSTSTLATAAGTIVFSTGTTTGNDNDTISNCNIGPAGANLPSKAIMASGTSSAIENDNVMITGNNIFDFFLPGSSLSGINILTGNEGWTISNNKFYQTATRTFTTTTLRYAAITLNNSTGSFTVSGNTIGFGAANGTGTTTITGSSNEVRGIDAASVNTTVATSIQGNTISGINQTTSRASTTTASSVFIAIAMGTTDGLFNAGNVTGNTIGSLDGSSTIVINATSTTASTAPVIGFYNFSFFSTNVSNNNIGAITIQSTGTVVGFRGILVNTTSGVTATINNNTIGGTNAAGAIVDTQVGSYAMYGIQTALPNLTATGNIVRNMSGASNGASLIVGAGILTSGATGANTISQNTIHSLSNASGAAANSIYGMSLSLPATANVIERNSIHSFSITSTVTGTQLWGISGGATGTATYKNNMIRLGLDAAGNSVTLPTSMIGIRDAAGSTNQFYHNSIYIGGTGVLATPTAANSYCFFSDVVTVTRAYQDNIFWNARSNAVGGGVAHLAIRVGGTAANPAGLTSNYNDLYFSGTDGATGVFNATVVPTLAAWRTATGQDANSFASDPQFIAPNGTSATGDLHIHPTNPTPIEGAGVLIASVIDDFDGQTRSSLTPVDIGADAGNFVVLDISPPSITYTPLGNTTLTTNRTLTATITDASGVAGGGNAPRVYYRKNGGSYVSTQSGPPSGSMYPCTIDYTLVGGVTAGDVVDYFVIAQDLAGNIASNPAGVVASNVNVVTTPPAAPNSYMIVAAFASSVNIGSGETITSLTNAGGLFAQMNSAVLISNVTINLTSDLTGETGSVALNQWTEEGAGNYTVTLKPSGAARSITGTVAAVSVIKINDADRFTIDGSLSGGTDRSLSITSINTAASTAVIWVASAINGATNNTIKNTILTGGADQSTGTNSTYGIISSSSAAILTGGADNDNNTYSNNLVKKVGTGIATLAGLSTNPNQSTTISNNQIGPAAFGADEIGTCGILLFNENAANVTNNEIRFVGDLATSGGGSGRDRVGIEIGSTSGNWSSSTAGTSVLVTNSNISGNLIHDIVDRGTFSAVGIAENATNSGSATANTIANNMIYNILANGTAPDQGVGIGISNGNGDKLVYNSVYLTGDIDPAGATTADRGTFGISVISTGVLNLDLRDNISVMDINSNTGTLLHAAINIPTSFVWGTGGSNFNDWFAPAANTQARVGCVGNTPSGTFHATLAAWKTATIQDANSISADPVFVSATDLHLLATSPALSVGTPVVGVTNDFDNDPRPASNPDIGADELVQAVAGSIPAGTYYNVSANDGNTLGGNVTVTNMLTLNGVLDAGANTLTIGCNGSIAGAGTNSYVVGNLKKVFCGIGNFNFAVGTLGNNASNKPLGVVGTEYSPVQVNLTAGTFPADFTVKAVKGPQPNIATPTRALQRYWTLTATGVTADLTFNYLDPTDIPAGATEANFVIFKYDGMFTMPGGSVNTVANTASITGVTSFSDWTLAEPNAPTDVALTGFSAEGLAASPNAPQGGVLLRWQTGFEVANLGFNLYRDDAGRRTRVNPNLIVGSAFFVGANTVLGAGRSYVWRDLQAMNPAAQYWLEEKDLNGNSFWHGPVLMSSAAKLAADSYEPNARLLNELSDDQNTDTATHTVERFATQRRATAAALATQQALTGNTTIKLAVNREGWYQIKVADLIAAGLDGRVNPQLLQLFVDGREQPINVTINKDGSLSGIEFYGTGVNNAYTNERAYWLLVGATQGKRIPKVASPGNASPGGSFLTTVERRDRTLYFSALRNGERENFFGAVIHEAVDQMLTLARVNSSAATAATLEVTLQGATSQAHSVRVELNGSVVGSLSFAGQASSSASFNVGHALLREGANTVRLVPLGGPGDVSLVDALRLSYQHYNTADGESLRLTATGQQALTIDGFSKPTIRVLDITDANAVQELIGVVQQQKSGASVSLQVPGTGQRTLLALASDLASPVSVAASAASSWRQPLNGADLVVITRKEFAAALDPLVTLRQEQGLSVAVVDIEAVYNEFSFGQKTPQAVKDLLLYAASSWKKKPRYVLLVGDASYDPKGYLGLGNSDLVPTKLFDTQYMETATDDFFVDFNNDGVGELAIGRLPARTASEALTMAAKIARYNSQTPADTLLLVSDLNDTYDFASASESLRGLIPADVRVQSLHRGDADDATTRARLIAAINNGQRLVNYVGHGSVELWRGGLLTSADVSSLTNSDRLAIFVMMTCLNGYYTDPAAGSLAEVLLKSERGGAVAVWASSGMTLPDAQALMNQEAYRQMFGSQGLTIGEAMTRAKAAVANGDVRRTWILLGDPTMKLR
ncbi:MAG: trimeric autotransporter adhesin [Blastocatellia bacterium]